MVANVGILALQGDIEEHRSALARCGAHSIDIRHPSDLGGIDALIMPGGESTTIGKLATDYGLVEPIREFVSSDRPVWGTCGGLILLANEIGQSQPLIGGLDVHVRRNAFGRQVDSFETDIRVAGLEDGPFRAVFIRAPVVEGVGSAVEVMARLDTGEVVAVRQGNTLGTSFHPELGGDDRLHRYFLQLLGS